MPAPNRKLRILVSAGPTREPLDPVRYLSNRSSGRMGYAIAGAAQQRGHAVSLVSGPVALPPPDGVIRIPVVTALEMLAALRAALPAHEVLIMAAAVADWRPEAVSPVKTKKQAIIGDGMTLALVRNPDILATLHPLKGNRLFVGFAAETGDPVGEGWRKLHAKGLDLLLANDVSRPDAGFEAPTNRVSLLAADGTREDWPLMQKTDLAVRLLERIETRFK